MFNFAALFEPLSNITQCKAIRLGNSATNADCDVIENVSLETELYSDDKFFLESNVLPSRKKQITIN